ncbi:GGDEF domain-containing protein [Egibacter rhizosphaerae]|uniref:GGDEF domain-containing protein n=1 Tax=Egibacter rhizosphaerae TaxID=1670831 RepID=A0A411YIM3_9ACTN|nr:GGDEF domain-containing protein [Egibacter rhizosphaerae]QBI21144.1 GGDEF domain-containing protein [Egibacter rhizosphaerae]
MITSSMSRGVLLVGTGVILVQALIQALLPGIPAQAHLSVVLWLTAGAVMLSARWHTPRPRLPFVALAAGLASAAAGYGIEAWVVPDRGPTGILGPVLVGLHLVTGACYLVAITIVVALRRPRGGHDGLIDAAAIVLAALLLGWQFGAAPGAGGSAGLSVPLVGSGSALGAVGSGSALGAVGSGSALGAVGSVSALVALAMCAVTWRLAFRAGEAAPVLLRLVAASALFAVGAGAQMLLSLDGALELIVDAARRGPGVLIASAVLHPAIRILTKREEGSARPVTPWRMLLLGAALLVLPALLVVQAVQFDARSSEVLPLAAGATALTALVLWRLGRLVVERERLRTDLQRREARFRELALYDSLTRLASRYQLMARLEALVAEVPAGAVGGTVAFVDLDAFKPVNDRYGHEVGDRVLCTVAERLSALVREGDTVSRLGGDEFILVCRDVATPAEAERLRYRLADALAVPAMLDGVEVPLSASVGLAMLHGGDDPEALIQRADTAMYEEKSAQRRGGGGIPTVAQAPS